MTRTTQADHQLTRSGARKTAPGGRARPGASLLLTLAVLALAGIVAGCGEDGGDGAAQQNQQQQNQQQPQADEPPQGQDAQRLAKRAADLERDLQQVAGQIFQNPATRSEAAPRLAQLQQRASELSADARAQLEGNKPAQDALVQAGERASAAANALSEFAESGSMDAANEARRALTDFDQQLAQVPDLIGGGDGLPPNIRQRLKKTGVDVPEVPQP